LLLAFLRRRVVDPHEVDDIHQETLIAMHRARHTYDPSRPLEPWLFTIARNVAADHNRRHLARLSWEVLLETPLEGATEPGRRSPRRGARAAPARTARGVRVAEDRVHGWHFSLEHTIERAETRARVRAAIARLPERYRDVVQETAAVLGISTGTVKTRLHRARQALRTLLAPHFAT
jgi:RNA polymerase sigma-70 factor (ECF subfamily)